MNRAAITSALLSTFPLSPDAVDRLISGSIESSTENDVSQLLLAQCRDLTNAAVPPLWARPLGPMSHALAVAATLDASSSAPPPSGPDLSVAASISSDLLSRRGGGAGSGFGSEDDAAALCNTIVSGLVAVLESPPWEPSPPRRAVTQRQDPLYSFRIGTRPLSETLVTPDALLREAQLYSIPLSLEQVGGGASLPVLIGALLPLPLQSLSTYFSSGDSTLPVFAVAQDGAVLSAGVCAVIVGPPISGNATVVSDTVATFAEDLASRVATAPTLTAFLSSGTLGVVLNAKSTASLATRSTFTASSSNTSLVTAANVETRALLVNVTVAALNSLIQVANASNDGSSDAPLLDDVTVNEVSLAIQSLTNDPFELDSRTISTTISALSVLLDATIPKATGSNGANNALSVKPLPAQVRKHVPCERVDPKSFAPCQPIPSCRLGKTFSTASAMPPRLLMSRRRWPRASTFLSAPLDRLAHRGRSGSRLTLTLRPYLRATRNCLKLV